MDEALRLGAKIREGAEVQNVHFSDAPYVTLAGDEKVYGDVVIGADGECMSGISEHQIQ